MAAYNGSKFIEDQLRTILSELPPSSEVIVVDDGSTDETTTIVRAIADARVRLVELGANRGFIGAFETALLEASNPLIFLADQDDLWPNGRVAAMVDALSINSMVAGNVCLFGDLEGRLQYRLRSEDSGRGIRNIVGMLLGRRSYFGSAMAFRADLLEIILPFPKYIEAHDHWVAVVGSIFGRITHIEDIVTMRRIHGRNLSASQRRSTSKLLKTRLIQAVSILDAARRGIRASSRTPFRRY